MADLFLRNLDALFFSDFLQEKGHFDPFFGALGGGGIDMFFLLFNCVARHAAFGVFLLQGILAHPGHRPLPIRILSQRWPAP